MLKFEEFQVKITVELGQFGTHIATLTSTVGSK